MNQIARLSLVDRTDADLSIVAQCRLLKVARSTLYYRGAPTSADDLRLMRRLDEQFMATPFYGSRRMDASATIHDYLGCHFSHCTYKLILAAGERTPDGDAKLALRQQQQRRKGFASPGATSLAVTRLWRKHDRQRRQQQYVGDQRSGECHIR
jgi:hypothetical protein